MTTQLNYLSQGSGIPLIFQHGLTANVGQIEGLLGGLGDLKLLSLDCPGHGRSSLHNNYVPSFANYADDVIALTDRMDIQQGIFGGLSMGSGIALNVVLRYPERVKALILLRPAWLAGPYPANLHILLHAAALMGRKGGLKRFEGLSSFEELKKEVPAAAQSVLGVFSDQQQGALPKVIAHMLGDRPFENMDRLEGIQVPCLIMANENDPLHPYAMAEQIHDKIGGSELHKITSRYVDATLYRTQVRERVSAFINEIK